ncbi:hypothetical protein B0H17DRAFT_1212286 [Mycena rosella]|uniref:Uncharacterized protein n=1 Tax=Mycena rosella TaxID=1033263 RepID=A0AAD7G6G1_MYCRO|nr:hypothetical protein B0H17DRAFT_1212286 [Mycena rosella]
MRHAPISWSTILVLENIASTEELYDKVNEHEEELVEAAKHLGRNSVMVHNLASHLRKLGFNQNSSRTVQRANLTVAEEEDGIADSGNEREDKTAGPVALEDSAADEGATLEQVYQTFKTKQRAPPPNGYVSVSKEQSCYNQNGPEAPVAVQELKNIAEQKLGEDEGS